MIPKILYWLIAGSRGGENRLRILLVLEERPLNAKQIADELGVDYKTVQHHSGVLAKHGLIDTLGGGYGKAYTLSAEMEANVNELSKIVRTKKRFQKTG